MKINSFYINEFKNIYKQKMQFPDSMSFLTLIGLNGSGKSNYLEAISLMFNKLFYSQDLHSNMFGFELDYTMSDGSKYTISNESFKKNGIEVERDQLSLPTNVIACYSGESQRLWKQAYEGPYMEFFNHAVSNEYDEPKMLYINKYAWPLCLIALLCCDDNNIREFLKSHFNVDEKQDAEVCFKIEKDKLKAYKSSKLTDLLQRLDDKVNIATLSSMDIEPNLQLGSKEFCRHLFFYLYLAFMPKRNNTNKIEAAITHIDVIIKGMSYRDISEGEKKLLLIKCISSLLANENSVIILDEPDAHVHIANKEQICNMCQTFPGVCILSTHSPYIINHIAFESIRYIDNGKIKEIDDIKALVSDISNHSIDILEGSLLFTNKRLIITEGPYDIKYIKHAAEKLSEDNEEYVKFKKISFVSQGGANNVTSFFEESIKPVLSGLDKVLFIFDIDASTGSGQKGYKEALSIIEQYPGKVDAIYYSKTYPIPANVSVDNAKPYYIEDYFTQEEECRSVLAGLSHPMSYADVMVATTHINKMKNHLKKRYENYQKAELEGFKVLLDEILRHFAFQ